ncbi:hypothetical protein DEO72_LG1g2530 [Vigna unguiculata]|uniref:Uncharacterized protein n=1 Tax=Vigna unguiculata TaxID=3917 RepID=A0A4D6KYF2_VIGUN|nr:hypothetical protein DEO72_LG1g2530 [Vigna unguiculata]
MPSARFSFLYLLHVHHRGIASTGVTPPFRAPPSPFPGNCRTAIPPSSRTRCIASSSYCHSLFTLRSS